MTTTSKRLTMGLALTAGLLLPSAADAQRRVRVAPPEAQIELRATGRFGQKVKGVRVHVNRPAWVTLFAVRPDGKMRRLTRKTSGLYATPRQPLMFKFKNNRRHRAPRNGEWVVAMTSVEPLGVCGVPYSDNIMFDAHFDGRWRGSFHESTVCRLAGVRRGRVHVTAVRVGFDRRPVHSPSCATIAQFGRRVPAGSRLYIDGRLCGVGAGALWGLAPGQHRVTVLTPSGRKFSDWVTVGHKSPRSEYYGGPGGCRYDSRAFAQHRGPGTDRYGADEYYENEFDD
jgi:hypothetical protein